MTVLAPAARAFGEPSHEGIALDVSIIPLMTTTAARSFSSPNEDVAGP